MRCSGLTASAVVALVVAAEVALATTIAGALPVDAKAGTAEPPVAPVVQLAAHKHKQWHRHGRWWREGPWADHAILGMVPARPWPSAVFRRWGADRLRQCAAAYRSFDPVTGTYITSRGKRRVCR